LPVNATTSSGGSDPRTATTLMLFEEFVPLEYRQQLAETTTTRRRLPSLFSPSSKSKQWKPAATLNGRPYVVGHVPRSPSYREVEFEGLLRGNASATKIITLSKRTSQAPARTSLSPPTAPPERAGTPRPGAISTVPGNVPARHDSLHPLAPVKPPASQESDVAPYTPSKRISRFRLPGGIPVPSPGGRYKSGMAPSEYSTLDFETRLAGYSDDEDNATSSGGKSKHKKGESRDDAWVDILVANHSRRVGGQDNEPKKPSDRIRGLKGGRSDPELASMEVAQALAGVRALSPQSDDDDRHEGPVTLAYHDSESEAHDGPVAEPDYREQDPEQDPDIDSIMSAPTRRRLGYFDLHPERRPRKSDEEDPRDRLAEANSDDEMDDGPVYSLGSSLGNRLPHTSLPHVELAGFDGSDDHRYQGEDASTTPQQVIVPPKRTTSKTAALIEMYRERERESTSSTKPPPTAPTPASSKLPVRSSSLPSREAIPNIPVEVSAPSPPPPPSLPLQPERELVLDLGEVHLVPLEETGRASPGRYIHGAPLHNVLEEEEED
jgi:hypothetical protein